MTITIEFNPEIHLDNILKNEVKSPSSYMLPENLLKIIRESLKTSYLSKYSGVLNVSAITTLDLCLKDEIKDLLRIIPNSRPRDLQPFSSRDLVHRTKFSP